MGYFLKRKKGKKEKKEKKEKIGSKKVNKWGSARQIYGSILLQRA